MEVKEENDTDKDALSSIGAAEAFFEKIEMSGYTVHYPAAANFAVSQL
ncbi:hypothetical protein QWY14_06655 [Planococcus sp. N028]|uniref:Uncharacterized protein n=1 Tax=Planococcus shixiaomingii TaxID=3058393 RepID=A0ABT8N0Q9_9BACL|nr:hypothetical protein [Planococcus sp. N028]MDN7241465.1 hypothetical protein [Planococcus sp. N028]